MNDTVACPSCSRTLRVPESLLGQLVKCPSCGHTFTAESAPAPLSDTPRREGPPPPPPEEAPRPSRRPARREDREDEDEEDRPRGRRPYQEHRGTLILVLGILGFVVAPIPFGPIAWLMGNHDLKEIDAGRMDPEGRDATQAGRICGMITTILAGVGLLACCSIFGLAFTLGAVR